MKLCSQETKQKPNCFSSVSKKYPNIGIYEKSFEENVDALDAACFGRNNGISMINGLSAICIALWFLKIGFKVCLNVKMGISGKTLQ